MLIQMFTCLEVTYHLTSFICNFITAIEDKDNNAKNKALNDGCNKIDATFIKKCKIVGPPVSYDHPVQPFFLTASRKVVNILTFLKFFNIFFIMHNNRIKMIFLCLLWLLLKE